MDCYIIASTLEGGGFNILQKKTDWRREKEEEEEEVEKQVEKSKGANRARHTNLIVPAQTDNKMTTKKRKSPTAEKEEPILDSYFINNL